MASTKLFLAVMAISVVSVAASAGGNRYEYPEANMLIQQQQQQQQEQQLKTCIDDSDCKGLGPGSTYRCFLYVCYPWKNDTLLPKSERRKTCRRDTDCNVADNEECVRHHDKRNVNKGLCFQVAYCLDGDLSECKEGEGCCNEHCCDKKYHQKFKDLPCISDNGCQDLSLGNFCCPRENNTSVCCDTDPNPPTNAPSVKDNGATGLANINIVMSITAAVILAKLAL